MVAVADTDIDIQKNLTSIEKSLIVAALTVEGSKRIDPLYLTTG